MIRVGTVYFLASCLWAVSAIAQSAAPDYQEVRDLIRAHLTDVSEAELDRSAVKGVVSALAPRVVLLSDSASPSNTSSGVLTRFSSFDQQFAYARIGEVSAGLAEKLSAALGEMSSTQKIKGLVLDLRFAAGEDYAAAAAVADLFVSKERPLLNWGEGLKKSTAKPSAISVPVTALVNGDTAGAAEAVAALIRETGVGLVLGGSTAGRALIYREFPLKNGEKLRVATGRVQVGETTLLGKGVRPDILVEVPAADKRVYMSNPYLSGTNRPPTLAMSSGNSTNVARRPRNEAELVREKREGTLTDESARSRRLEPEKPLVTDPVLARALDLLKGLSVVRGVS